MTPRPPEFRLIERLLARLPDEVTPVGASDRLLIGAGDDATVWERPDGTAGIFTVDTLVEGVHAFPFEPPRAVGGRALTAAVSDVAAMGGEPVLALVALQAPKDQPEERFHGIYDDIADEARRLGVAVVGGDVVDTPGPLALAVAVYGTFPTTAVWTRSGALPGDVLVLSGTVGGSRAGLEILRSSADGRRTVSDADRPLVERHLSPHARPDTARALRLMHPSGVHAAIDVSDGLSSDAWHLARASNVQLEFEAARIPLHPAVEGWLEMEQSAAVRWALDSGEEYELLLALAPGHPLLDRLGEEAVGAPAKGCEDLTVIGAVGEGPATVVLIDRAGRAEEIAAGGWSHRRDDGDDT